MTTAPTGTAHPESDPDFRLHSVVDENDFWEKIDLLRSFGAEGILVIPIEKMIV